MGILIKFARSVIGFIDDSLEMLDDWRDGPSRIDKIEREVSRIKEQFDNIDSQLFCNQIEESDLKYILEWIRKIDEKIEKGVDNG